MEQNDELASPSFEEPILWQYSPSKYTKFTRVHIYASIGPLACLLTGLILALTGVIVWIGLLLFGGVAAVTFLIICLALPRKGKPIYAITETKIGVDPFTYIDFANIEKIKKSCSLFNKNFGTIKFKVKKGFSENYRFANIEDVDAVYDLLLSLWKKQK